MPIVSLIFCPRRQLARQAMTRVNLAFRGMRIRTSVSLNFFISLSNGHFFCLCRFLWSGENIAALAAPVPTPMHFCGMHFQGVCLFEWLVSYFRIIRAIFFCYTNSSRDYSDSKFSDRSIRLNKQCRRRSNKQSEPPSSLQAFTQRSNLS